MTSANATPLTLRSAIDAVKKAKDGTDVQAIKNAVSNLPTAAHALAQHMGRGAGGPPPDGGQQPPSGGGKDDVIDAEFEVKK